MCTSLRISVIFCCVSLFLNLTCDTQKEVKGARIVSLSPAMTEILFSLGAGDRLVGVTTFCDYPEQAKSIAKVGDFSHPSIERIVGLRPEMVIVNLPEQMRITRELEKLRIKIFTSSPRSLDEIFAEILALGKELDLNKQADSLVTYMKGHLQPVKTKHRKKVYVEISPKPIITVGANTFLNDLIDRAGGVNIFGDLNKDYPVVSQEAVIVRDPDLIIALHPETVTGRTGWQKINAIKNGRVYTGLNQDHLMRPGPRLVQGFEALAKVIND